MSDAVTQNINKPIFSYEKGTGGAEIRLHSPLSMPNATGYLWNKKMMFQMTCRGYANALHMQPEPAKYAYGQSFEAKTFMQPEHHYYSGHPGRFFYIKLSNSDIFSLPYEPTRQTLDKFAFIQGQDTLRWEIEHANIQFTLRVTLADDVALEDWRLDIVNKSNNEIHLDIYPCFTIGYASWMNQSARFVPELNGILGEYITPYQKAKDYPKIKQSMDKTLFIADSPIESFDTSTNRFLGEGHMHCPDGVKHSSLFNSTALYETPIAVLQHKIRLEPRQQKKLSWLFGPCQSETHAKTLSNRLQQHITAKPSYLKQGISIQTPNADLNHMINSWLPRQLSYHIESNRLTTDPQTRNFLQDHLSSIWLNPTLAKRNLLLALSQQGKNGAMPDGILLHEGAELKYINQVPHSDHNVWLFPFVELYLSETNDFSILETTVGFGDSDHESTVSEHLELACDYLWAQRDHRGLSLIQQGDWCDPMNMVGIQGRGVSFWLTFASAYAFGIWSKILKTTQDTIRAAKWHDYQQILNDTCNTLGWDGDWYARGITDDDEHFGISRDQEGQIFLNPQAWAMLSEAPTPEQADKMVNAIESKLRTPFGYCMLAPAYTHMDERIGRVTQKFPGTAENGSVYNHAASFYAYALYQQAKINNTNKHNDIAFEVLFSMLATDSDCLKRGQLPNFIPNYYRGAYHQLPEAAGRSSQLFNTGTCAWYYRSVIEGLFGIKQSKGSLTVKPNLPSSWTNASISKKIFGANVRINIKRGAEASVSSDSNNLQIEGSHISGFEAKKTYLISVIINE
ncbi:GH36-type glycosyl hydrolase domain-containing protein [Agaribacter marinus]|uniref:Cellobionic acid phosphorylase n=1 Tax=Agaribacter marinus TaxID=1431249 RepID=A0AA37SZJ4_9ALTE|nr:NdvB protein [Agaribacter marinus]GLR71534.1 cellobionic acid phosphorylase [Agaribacter marinus]